MEERIVCLSPEGAPFPELRAYCPKLGYEVSRIALKGRHLTENEFLHGGVKQEQESNV
ncbi:MAG TPA: hypothetical protein PKL70_14495 [Saprospiraceae bacterium]|nr:hypothetical protein [Saprospiraceae bacterium]